jgi:hypothetical protein
LERAPCSVRAWNYSRHRGRHLNGGAGREGWARALTLRRILGYLDVRIGSSGLIGGGRLARRLEQAIGTTSIEDLPVRFRAIATEVGTGMKSG